MGTTVSQAAGVLIDVKKKQSTKEKTSNLAVIPKDLASLNFFLNSQIQQKSFLISHILFSI